MSLYNSYSSWPVTLPPTKQLFCHYVAHWATNVSLSDSYGNSHVILSLTGHFICQSVTQKGNWWVTLPLITVLSSCITALHYNTVSSDCITIQYCHAALPLCAIILCCHIVLSYHITIRQCCHSALPYFIKILHYHTMLSHCIIILY